MRKFIYLTACCLLFVSSYKTQAQSIIQGQVSYHHNWFVNGAKVTLVNAVTGALVDSTITDTLGYYSFNQVPAGSYLIQSAAYISDDGVNLADALLVIHYLAPGQNVSLDKIQKRAADMNNDGLITHSDANAIIAKWVNNKSKKKNSEVDGWVYVLEQSSDTAVVGGVPGDTLTLRILGSAEGDADGNLVPQKKPSGISYLRYHGTLTRNAAEKFIDIPIHVYETFTGTAIGLALSIQTPGAHFSSFESCIDDSQYSIADQHLRLSWVSSDAQPIMFQEGQLIGIMRIAVDPAYTGGIDIQADAATHVTADNGLVFKKTLFSIPEILGSSMPLTLYPNFPNPVFSSTSIPFDISEAGDITLHIYDLQGRIVCSRKMQNLKPGFYTLSFTRQDEVAGPYVLDLQFENDKQHFRLTSKMILAD